ncbi:MAG TPA: aldo/keto reductase [Bacteroidia bacterium]|nr:aldo/keto reductase [Bacteroidia bacterium]
MQKRKLGNTDLHVAPITFGCNVFGWTANEKTSFEILDAFTTAGFNFLDTADVYAKWATGVGGESETIIGKWTKQRNNRNKVIIATKAGMVDAVGTINITKAYIIKAAEESLKRLQTDYIDLYQTHKDDLSVPVEETLEAHQQLIKEGKVRFIGASNFSAARLKASLEASKKHNLPRYETLQPLYNLYDREIFEKELEPLCVANNIGVINYYSLAAGFLTGKYRTQADVAKSARGARVASTYLNEKGLRILKTLDEVAAQYKTTTGSIAMAWLLARPAVTAPIASASNLVQLQELIKSVDLKLSAETINLLNKASS